MTTRMTGAWQEHETSDDTVRCVQINVEPEGEDDAGCRVCFLHAVP